MSSVEVSAAIGVSRATAQRYLATLATTGDVTIGLRYGTTRRPEQEFAAGASAPTALPAERGATPRTLKSRVACALVSVAKRHGGARLAHLGVRTQSP